MCACLSHFVPACVFRMCIATVHVCLCILAPSFQELWTTSARFFRRRFKSPTCVPPAPCGGRGWRPFLCVLTTWERRRWWLTACRWGTLFPIQFSKHARQDTTQGCPAKPTMWATL
jgi:hypothetical protein